MARLATTGLHNVQSIESVNISASLVEDRVKKPRSGPALSKVVGLLRGSTKRTRVSLRLGR